jgi:hypothetical protein
MLCVTIKLLDQWMKPCTTNPDLRECIYEYAMGRGGVTMAEVYSDIGYNEQYRLMARAQAQNAIVWRCFTEGMVCKEIRATQKPYTDLSGLQTSAEKWMVELITKLLEVIHGQWLYPNIHVHNRVAGTLATLRREENHV